TSDPVLSDFQYCRSFAFTSSNRPISLTYKAFQTSGALGFASMLSARLVICTPFPSKIHWMPSTSYRFDQANENRPLALIQVPCHTDPQLCSP
ncbi:hypothetical protein FIBSPDRAFT_873034, partial [Athelia psychrophila]